MRLIYFHTSYLQYFVKITNWRYLMWYNINTYLNQFLFLDKFSCKWLSRQYQSASFLQPCTSCVLCILIPFPAWLFIFWVSWFQLFFQPPPIQHGREDSTLSDKNARNINRMESLKLQQRILKRKDQNQWQADEKAKVSFIFSQQAVVGSIDHLKYSKLLSAFTFRKRFWIPVSCSAGCFHNAICILTWKYPNLSRK